MGIIKLYGFKVLKFIADTCVSTVRICYVIQPCNMEVHIRTSYHTVIFGLDANWRLFQVGCIRNAKLLC